MLRFDTRLDCQKSYISYWNRTTVFKQDNVFYLLYPMGAWKLVLTTTKVECTFVTKCNTKQRFSAKGPLW